CRMLRLHETTGQLVNLFGELLRYLSGLAFSAYLHQFKKEPSFAHETPRNLDRNLSLGHWTDFLADTLLSLDGGLVEDRSEIITKLIEGLDKDCFGLDGVALIRQLVESRNNLQKRTGGLPNTQNQIDDFRQQVFKLLSRFRFLADYPLFCISGSYVQDGVKWHECQKVMGANDIFTPYQLKCQLDLERYQLYWLDSPHRLVSSLYPTYFAKPNHQSVSGIDIYRFNRLDQKRSRVVYESYGSSKSHFLMDTFPCFTDGLIRSPELRLRPRRVPFELVQLPEPFQDPPTVETVDLESDQPERTDAATVELVAASPPVQPPKPTVEAATGTDQEQRQPTPLQRQAIQTTEGPLLIIAGPGSGKTFVLVERVKYLIARQGVKPENILVATYTNKAARELISRITTQFEDSKLPFQQEDMYIGTFHSICMVLLRQYQESTEYTSQIVQLDDFDQQYFVYQRLPEYQAIPGIHYLLQDAEDRLNAPAGFSNTFPRESANWHYADNIRIWMDRVSEKRIDFKKLAEKLPKGASALEECYVLYQRHLIESGYIDFANLQKKALQLLKENHIALAEVQAKIKYIIVDEYQDTSKIQEDFLFTIAGENPNICVVGDDDQGLYRFRSANVTNIQRFDRNFQPGECREIKLEENFRSHPGIIEFFNRWMDHDCWSDNEFRSPKQIRPAPGKDFEDRPSVLEIPDYIRLVHFLKQLKAERIITDWNQVVVLAQSLRRQEIERLQQVMRDNEINVYAPRAKSFFRRWEIRLAVGALIRLFPHFDQLRQFDNSERHLKIWQYFDGKCRPEFEEYLASQPDAAMAQWYEEVWNRLSQTLPGPSQTPGVTFTSLFYELIQFEPFRGWLTRAEGDSEHQRIAKNLAKLSDLLQTYERIHGLANSRLTPDNLAQHIRDLFSKFFTFLYNTTNEAEEEENICPPGFVTYMTIHQAKGLQFPVVVVVPPEYLVFQPRHNELKHSVDQSHLQQDDEPPNMVPTFDALRKYYTAFSRAQDLLILTRPTPKHSIDAQFERILQGKITDRSSQLNLTPQSIRPVVSSNLNVPYSFTRHFDTFSTCARQYRFFNQLGFVRLEKESWLYGTLVHQTIDDIHRQILANQTDQITDVWLHRQYHENYELLVEQRGVELQTASLSGGLDDIQRYVRRQQHTWPDIVAAEINVSKAEQNFILNGKVDLIRQYKDGLEIIDFKTGFQRAGIRNEQKLLQYQEQLEIYAHLVERQDAFLNQRVLRVGIYFTADSDAPYETFDRQVSELDLSRLQATVERIEANDFTLEQRPRDACQDCEMRYFCDTSDVVD
ncbi:MAG: ATP-dependent DNA helicase, partial [Candidatus Poribacteria bacterium]|nr:ATP-dependent DNA helicase [Candidatus Poribacteria bacterium]